MDLSHSLFPQLTKGESLSTTLERLILNGDLRPGERLPSERALADELDCSRGSVRDAFRDLSQKGLVLRKPGTGTVVQGFDASPMGRNLRSGLTGENVELIHVMELRACIEPPLAERAALRATKRDIAQLEKIVADTRGIDAGTEFAALDRTFHLAIAQYTYNPLLVSLLDRAHELAAPSRSEKFLTRARMTSSVRQHQAIVDAITARDSHAAYAAAAAHLESVQSQILMEIQT